MFDLPFENEFLLSVGAKSSKPQTPELPNSWSHRSIQQLKNATVNFHHFIFTFLISILAARQPQHVKPIGCFKDQTHRSFPEFLANFRSEITDWNNFDLIIEACSKLSRQKGYRYFGIQFYGECWSGEIVEFEREGRSFRCIKGVGQTEANFVYENIPKQGKTYNGLYSALFCVNIFKGALQWDEWGG